MARDEERDEGLEHTGYRSGRVRIVGAEPAGRSAAMGSDDDGESPWSDEQDSNGSEEQSPAFVTPPLPHWTEPATGEVPSILGREPDAIGSDPFASLPGPTWREEGSDWEAQDEDFEPSMLAGDQTGQGSLDSGPSDRQPWVFDLPGSKPSARQIFGEAETGWEDGESDWEDLALAVPAPSWASEDEIDDPITAVIPKVGGEPDDEEVRGGLTNRSVALGEEPDDPFGAQPPRAPGDDDLVVIDDLGYETEERPPRFRSQRSENRRAAAAERKLPAPRRPAPSPNDRLRSPSGPQTDEAPPRNVVTAIISGVVLGAVALLTFKLGPAPAVALVTAVVTMAAAEAYAAFRQGGYHPVTLLGLVATVSLMVATYNKGEAALPLVLVLLVAACFVWHLAGVERTDAVRSTGTTLFVFAWVAVFGSFGALLLSPALFPDRHGIAFLLGGVIAGVSYDVGALTFGAWLGRHPMASVSPNKTWEGFVGGLLTSVVFSVVIVHMIHPWTVGKAAALGLVVSIVSTLGDLFESTVKRHLGRKDMGRLLPGHGGLLDRVDGLLFVLPATFYLVIAFHLG